MSEFDFSTGRKLKQKTDAVSAYIPDTGYLDAFGRLRISSPETLFDSKMLMDNQPLYWSDVQFSGAGTNSTYNNNQASVTLSVSNSTAGVRVRQTLRSFNYQSGKSQLIFMTGVFGAQNSGIKKRIGYFNNNDGLFFELNNAGMHVVTRSNTSGFPVDIAINQTLWNIDKMDGTGKSGVTLDFLKSQIMIIDFEWLGVGRVRFGWVIDGSVYYCHEFLNTNNLDIVYMSTPNFPVRYEISNDGSGVADSLLAICSTVISEGGIKSGGSTFSADRGAVPLVTLNDANLYPLIALRLKSTHLFADIDFLTMSLVCTSSATIRWAILLNPNVVGVPLNFVGINNSAIEADVSRLNTTTVNGGTILLSGYDLSSATSSIVSSLTGDMKLGANAFGVSDVIVLAVQRMAGGTTETFYGSLGWREL